VDFTGWNFNDEVFRIVISRNYYFCSNHFSGTLPVEYNYSNRAGPVRNNEDTCAVVAFSDSLKWATERMLLPLKRRTKNAWA
jgi:hypothetical protein